MRPLEGFILIAILFSLLGYLVPKSRRPRWLSLLPALAALYGILCHIRSAANNVEISGQIIHQ